MKRWLLIVLFSFACQSLSAQTPVALVTSMQGKAYAVAAEGTERGITIGSLIFEGETVKTAKKSHLKLLFTDKSYFVLQEHSDLTIDTYLYEKNKKAKATYSVSNAVFEFLVGEIAKEAPEEFSIQTPTATIGIRGSGGYATVSDGLKGKKASLTVSPMEGHSLVVTPDKGEPLLLDDPAVAVRVDAQGRITMLYGVKGIKEETQRTTPLGKPSQQPFEKRKGVLVSWVLPPRNRIKLKKIVITRVDCAMMQLTQDLFGVREEKSVAKERDIDLSKEVPDVGAVLKKANSKQKTVSVKQKDSHLKSDEHTDEHKGVDLKHRVIKTVDEREGLSSQEVLNRLSSQEKQRSNQLQKLSRPSN